MEVLKNFERGVKMTNLENWQFRCASDEDWEPLVDKERRLRPGTQRTWQTRSLIPLSPRPRKSSTTTLSLWGRNSLSRQQKAVPA